MPDFIDLLKQTMKEREEVLSHIDKYLNIIKQAAKELDPEARVLIFGSYVRGNFRPDSDIDILIISDKYGVNSDLQAKMNAYILMKCFWNF